MAARLILNADDFGLTPGINHAVAELYTNGALTSATLMATGPAFDDAIAVARSNPALGIGCHIVLTDGTPASPPATIPTLVQKSTGAFRSSLPYFFLSVLLGQVSEAEIEAEALAQIHKLQAAGIHVTHLDTHKHTHILPGVARPLLRAAERAGIRAVRNPFEQRWSLALGSSSVLRDLQLRLIHYLRPRFLALPQIASGRVRTTDGTIGISATGNLNRQILTALLANLPEGTWELVCHPGYNDADLSRIATRLRTHRDIERAALLSTVSANAPHTFPAHLIRYDDLAAKSLTSNHCERTEP